MKATGTSIDEFLELIPTDERRQVASGQSRPLSPMPGAYKANQAPGRVRCREWRRLAWGGFFDDGGFPAGQGWDEVKFPTAEHDSVYALQVTGGSDVTAFYRHGDVVIVAPGASVRKGNRVVVRTRSGRSHGETLQRKSAKGCGTEIDSVRAS
ncbi:MAG: S24 family peptidase [Nitratireductor sp.]